MARKRDSTDATPTDSRESDEPNRAASRAGPKTDSELNESLKRLLADAAENGVSIEGGWAVRNGPTLPDWDVHITQVTKPED